MTLDDLLDVLILHNIKDLYINGNLTKIHMLTPELLSGRVRTFKIKTEYKTLTTKDIEHSITYFDESDTNNITSIQFEIPEQSIYTAISAHIEVDERRWQ